MLYLIVSIAGQRLALPTEHVESVVEIETVTPVPLAAPHIAGLSALRSRVLTVVDSLAALEFGRWPLQGTLTAVIVTVEAHLYGLLVEQVEDVVEIPGAVQPVRVVLAPGWTRAARGIIEHDGDALLVLDPAVLVAGPQTIAA